MDAQDAAREALKPTDVSLGFNVFWTLSGYLGTKPPEDVEPEDKLGELTKRLAKDTMSHEASSWILAFCEPHTDIG